MSGAADGSFPIENLSEHIVIKGDALTADKEAQEMLHGEDAWAMILDDNGNIIWENGLPEKLQHKYSVADVAMFSRWYIEDYPVSVWKRLDGLLVVGFQPDTVFKHNLSFKMQFFWPLQISIVFVVILNLFLMIYLFLRNAHRVEKAMLPILNGIHSLSNGKSFHLDEGGELSEISNELNLANEYLMKKDNTRAEWINGISHDVRTPLSIMLGYAGEIENDTELPARTRKQAEIICKQGEKLRRLIVDLNLTSKLEYSMQPLHLETIYPVELARQIISDYLNNDIGDAYSFDLQLPQDTSISMQGDQALLTRLLENLIRNSIAHSPNGCNITVSVAQEDGGCTFVVMDDGIGVSDERLRQFNAEDFSGQTYQVNGEAAHGLGLRLVYQIVKAHGGQVHFAHNAPHGLVVKLLLPIREI